LQTTNNKREEDFPLDSTFSEKELIIDISARVKSQFCVWLSFQWLGLGFLTSSNHRFYLLTAGPIFGVHLNPTFCHIFRQDGRILQDEHPPTRYAAPE
jgi:hypothetical protein